MPVIQPPGAIVSLATGAVADAVLAPGGQTLYLARGNTIAAYDTASGTVTGTWTIGTDPGAIDLSADGRYLAIVERAPGAAAGGTTQAHVYRLDLATGIAATFTGQGALTGATFHDVAFLPDGRALLTTSSDGETPVPLTTLDFTAGSFTPSGAYAPDGTLTATPDKSRILFLPGHTVEGPLHVFTAGSGVTASHGNFEDGVFGRNTGVQAISPAGDLILQGLGLNLYGGALDFRQSLGARYSYLTGTGMAFSPAGDRLYMLEAAGRQVIVFDTADWSVIGGYALPRPIAASTYFGNALQVSADGTRLIAIGEDGIAAIDLTLAISDRGTSGDDTIEGTATDDQIFGFEGDDTIDGGMGADILHGGAGNDTYHIGDGDTVIEHPGEGDDTVIASISHVLAPEVERLTLIANAFFAAGNSGANLLTGNALDNELLGFEGDDRIDGGGGSDVAVYGGNRADYSVEQAGQGLRLIDQRADGDGSDLVYNVETFRFADGDIAAADLRADLPPPGGDWRLFAGAGFTGSIGGGGTVLGTADFQDVTVVPQRGRVTFDPSFNRGGDVIRLPGTADDWTIARSGSTALLVSGQTSLAIPVGAGAGTALVFADGARTLRFDAVEQSFTIGAQAFADSAVQISAVPDGRPLPGGADPGASARLFLAEGGSVTLGGTVDVLGTAGPEHIALLPGAFPFDPSFNRGGDTIALPLAAGAFTAARSGSSLVLDSAAIDLLVPVGTTATILSFTDGDRLLLFDPALGSIMLGGQTIGFDPVPLGSFG